MPLGAFAPLPIRLGGSAADGWTATQHARVCADMVSVKRTAPLAVVSVTVNASTATASGIFQGTSGYSSVGAVRNADGDATFSLPATWSDAYGVEHRVVPRVAEGTCANNMVHTFASCMCSVSGSAIRVVTTAVSGTARNGTSTVVVY
jgi:hypothetical protein